jgi:hypothetical protein
MEIKVARLDRSTAPVDLAIVRALRLRDITIAKELLRNVFERGCSLADQTTIRDFYSWRLRR